MSEASTPLLRRLFEAPTVEDQAPAAKAVTYLLLILWSLVVLVPLYWVLITSRPGTSCCGRTTRPAPT